jgi:hypothetical protein
MSCQPIAGYEREMFWAGCTMNIGSKKLLREVASTFCGAQGFQQPPEHGLPQHSELDGQRLEQAQELRPQLLVPRNEYFPLLHVRESPPPNAHAGQSSKLRKERRGLARECVILRGEGR